jgi:hypothetical protein
MDTKTANSSDAAVTPHLMGMSPDVAELADSAWLNESADLDEIDVGDLANSATVVQLVDLPKEVEDFAAPQQRMPDNVAPMVQTQTGTSENEAPLDAPLRQQVAASSEIPIKSATPEPTQVVTPVQEAGNKDAAQHTPGKPDAALTPEGMMFDFQALQSMVAAVAVEFLWYYCVQSAQARLLCRRTPRAAATSSSTAHSGRRIQAANGEAACIARPVCSTSSSGSYQVYR